jgi:nitronate monooxygenase/enoyl-[acyl-carrier protein] reductase II
MCDLIGIEYPVVQAAVAPFTSAELVAAVSNAGGLGSFATALRPLEDVRQQLACIRELTDRPIAVNFTLQTFDEDVFALVLEARPAVISLALGDPGDLVERAHAAGCLVMQQVHTVQQAREVEARGVDIIIAQGSEAGGFTGTVGALALIPQVVDAVRPIPVVAAGGIADGRGLAAALVLGAQGVNVGTRFLASVEASCGDAWKQAIVGAESEDAVQVDAWWDIFPRPDGATFDTAPRALRTPFVDQWQRDREGAQRQSAHLQAEIMESARRGRLLDFVPFTGQTAGAIREVLPAAEIVRRLVAEAKETLERANAVPV